MSIAGGVGQEVKMQQYVSVLKDLDDRRQGLDFEIQDILEDLDTQATYENLDPKKATVQSFA